MYEKNITTILAVTVGIIMIGSILAVVISGFDSETLTYTNEGIPYATMDEDSHTIVISYDGTDYSITSDGESTEVPDLSLYGSATIVYGSDGLVRLGSNGYVRGFTTSGLGGLNVDEDTPITVVTNSDGATISDGATTLAYPFTPSHYIAVSGDYVLCQNPRVTDDTVILAGITSYNSYVETIAWYGTGTIEEITASVIYASLTDSKTVSSVSAEVNTTAITTDLVKIDSIVFTAELSDSSEYTATFSYFLAPMTITYENAMYVGDGAAGLLSAVMVVSILAVLMVAVKLVKGRDD